ncbi:hypothetical protein LTR84_008353 [Exophiala bonariae]|uniref:DUF7708 domain-containing protein n=1 Tax=Exophiala bonariae TaxID=1690606 RepID=A0AAV9N156_9EURO|nr:hypothetical protein LTR84_008353 [Exophiala bonariae]
MAVAKSSPLVREFFEADPNDQSVDPAHDAFREGVLKFKDSLTQDPKKAGRAQQATSLEAVSDAVEAAQLAYDTKHGQSKTRERLRRFNATLHYYGNIMDVLVQHHPEYVSLAWGAMKFVFTTCLNHEATISALAKGLCKVGNTLPRVRLAIGLYPTRRMKNAISELYAYIIRFLIRAHDWYQENWLQHIWHSVTRLVELRYNDILDEIAIRTQIVHDLAVAGGLAEQRVMHEKLDAESSRVIALEAKLQEMTALLVAFKTMASGAFLDTNHLLTDLQISNVLDYVAHVPLPDPAKALRFGMFMREHRRSKHTTRNPNYAWVSPRLQTWSDQKNSSLVTVRGAFQSRNEMKDLSVELVELLQKSGIPVLWALKSTSQDGIDAQQPSAIDVLKYLTSQALRLSSTAPTEASMSSVCMRFKTASTADEWNAILASTIPVVTTIYLVIDVEVLNYAYADVPGSFWPAVFFKLSAELEARGSKTSVKVALISYGTTNQVTSSALPQGSKYWVANTREPLRQLKVGSRGNVSGGSSGKSSFRAGGQRSKASLIRLNR